VNDCEPGTSVVRRQRRTADTCNEGPISAITPRTTPYVSMISSATAPRPAIRSMTASPAPTPVCRCRAARFWISASRAWWMRSATTASSAMASRLATKGRECAFRGRRRSAMTASRAPRMLRRTPMHALHAQRCVVLQRAVLRRRETCNPASGCQAGPRVAWMPSIARSIPATKR
jgi:hypothetical protein